MKTAILVIFLVIFSVGFATAGPGGTDQRAILTDSAIGTTGSTSIVAMGQTAAIIKAAPSGKNVRYALTVKNMGSNAIYIGFSSSITPGTDLNSGFQLNPGQWYTFDKNYSSIYGICASGLTSTANYIEEGK